MPIVQALKVVFVPVGLDTATGYVPFRFTLPLSFPPMLHIYCFVIHRRTQFSQSIWMLNISSPNSALQIPGSGRLGPRHFGVAPNILPSIYFYIMCSFRFWKTPAHCLRTVVYLSFEWVICGCFRSRCAISGLRWSALGDPCTASSVYYGLLRVDVNWCFGDEQNTLHVICL